MTEPEHLHAHCGESRHRKRKTGEDKRPKVGGRPSDQSPAEAGHHVHGRHPSASSCPASAGVCCVTRGRALPAPLRRSNQRPPSGSAAGPQEVPSVKSVRKQPSAAPAVLTVVQHRNSPPAPREVAPNQMTNEQRERSAHQESDRRQQDDGDGSARQIRRRERANQASRFTRVRRNECPTPGRGAAGAWRWPAPSAR